MTNIEHGAPEGAGRLARRPEGAISCSGLRKVFPGRGTRDRLVALDNVNFEVGPAEFVSLLGPSGCGKSTLLRIISGLETASSGEAWVGSELFPPPGPDRGFVFQQDALLPWRSVEKNVRLGLELIGTPKDEAHARAIKLLDLVGLGRFASSYPHELSGGMRQRANLIRALAVDPRVLLMDEPFGALDAQTRELMQAELLRIWEESKKTVVFVTHSIEEAVYLSDRVLIMSARPGAICSELRVPLGRPRDLDLRRTEQFTEICRDIWLILKEEVEAAQERESDTRSHGMSDLSSETEISKGVIE